jgi:hypothetical protein
MTALSLEEGHAEMGLAPVADAFDTATGVTDVINMRDHERIRFTLFWGVGATGTITITVEACDDVVPTNTSAIPFRYRVTPAGGAPGAILAATAAGFTTTAGSNQIVEVEVTAEALSASGYSYIRLKPTEVVNSPILGGILVNLFKAKFAGGSHISAVV